ncbi:MAG: transport-associated protein [Deltaproteobacteria bacterium HGW-Deltaproteobacteria-6]|jgi:osmotically-inducible protein OsmY|nr:MAG: transport-associated protein [Deltaproteobacteria bacterium HGW-Deltaproteobacteria-6]
MKASNRLAVIVAATVALLALSVPVYASRTDDRIESSAKKSYVFQTYLQGDDVKIQSLNGAVTLTGTVAEESHKILARDTVAGLPGVKSVDNKLEIKGESPAERSDAWITAKVKTMFLFHRNVSAMTEVDTKDGIVTLKGKALNSAQKDLTTEYAKDVEGVKDVVNEMTVGKDAKKKQTAGSRIDDASITAQVKMTLLYHRSTSGISTSVATKKGVVTLTGKAKSEAEKDLAAKFAGNVNGVKAVNNKMSIE